MSKRDEIIAILREWHWDGGTEPVADRILACVAQLSMAPAEEAAIRARDAALYAATNNGERRTGDPAWRDRRTLLAELDRLRGLCEAAEAERELHLYNAKVLSAANDRLRALLAEPTEAMVEEADHAFWVCDDDWRSAMRAALVAAGQAMVRS